MKKLCFVFLISFFFINYNSGQVTQQWINNSNTSPTFNYINLDGSGNIYTVGWGSGMDTPDWTVLEKISPYGLTIYDYWINNFDTTGHLVGVYLDSLYNEYIAGFYGGPWGPSSFWIMKYNSAGARLWRTVDTISYNDVMFDVTGDKSGNSFVLRNKGGVNQIVKYNSSGVQQFLFVITDTINPKIIKLDYQGNIIVSGTSLSNSFSTIKYNSTFDKLWKSVFINSGGYVYLKKVLIGFTGNIFVLGDGTVPSNNYDYTVIKYNTSGIQQWVSYYDYNHLSDDPSSIRIDNLENVYVTGSTGTVKFNFSGQFLWHDTTSGMNDLVLDKYDNVYITGSIGSFYQNDIMTVKLDFKGYRVWSKTFNGTQNAGDGANAIAIDTSLNVYVTGYTNAIPIYQYSQVHGITIKYSQAPIDTNSPKYFPLQIGNIWVYKYDEYYPPPAGTHYYAKYFVSKDTIMNYHRYFRVRLPGTDTVWVRYDSLTSDLSYYSTTNGGCSFNPNEIIIDSLSSRKFDSVVCSGYILRRCTDTGSYNIFNITTSRKNFDYCPLTCIARDYAKNFGIYNAYYGEIDPMTYLLQGCVINGIVYGDTSTVFYTVSGTVRYQDNNQTVNNGYVKALRIDKITMQVITVDSANIQSNGTYSLIHIPHDSTFIMAYADDENDFVPTYHDSTIYWQNASIVYPGSNMTNIDVYVYRVNKTPGPMHIGGGVFALSNSFAGLQDAFIYAKIGNQFKGYSHSGTTGSYRIDSLLQNNYTVICDRIGYDGGTKNIALSSTNQDTVNFYLRNIMKIDIEGVPVPTSYALFQNYPNPFNPVTTIKFALPKTSHVQLVIYDLLGREVTKLVDEQVNTGTYKVDWNASNYASGLYFYKLTATAAAGSSTGDFVETKKLVLIK